MPPEDPSPSKIQALIQDLERIGQRLKSTSIPLPYQIHDELAAVLLRMRSIRDDAARLEEEHQDLLGLVEVGKVINSTLRLQDVLRMVMDTLVRLTEAERGFLMLRDGDTGQLVMRVARNWEQESIAPDEFAISRTVIDRVATSGKPILTTNAQEDPRFDTRDSVVAFKLRSIVCVPLKVKNRLTGVIYADNRIQTGLFTRSDLTLLTAFANQAAVAIENARLFQSVRETLEEVTGLKNLMDNVFSSIASGVITTDIEDRITLCNRAAGRILNVPARDLVGGKLDRELSLLGDSLSRAVHAVQENDQSVIGLEISPALSPNEKMDLSLHISPLKDARGSTQGAAIVLDDLTEKKRLEAKRRLFERMVSPAVIEQLNPDQLQLGGKRSRITTLFFDLRGFTHFSEKLPPEELVSILNTYLASAVDGILMEEGTIDKFLGDAVMAWFNAPIPQEDHVLRAVRTALGIREKIALLRGSLPREFQLSFGIGIHTGEAVLGLIGSEKRIEYTAIGDSVNTAKRIQENARDNQILISRDALARLDSEIKTRPVDPILAKGKSSPIEVFEVIG